jgi:polyisoprenoid-binding protein YceI
MKQLIVRWSSIVLTTFFPILIHATSGTFTLDKNHSYVLWNATHIGFSTQTGKWYATGTLVLDKEHPEKSSVTATINMADLVTGLPEFDKHLKSKSFFDVEQYPKATFTSNKVMVLGKDKADVTGTLTLRGVSKPVVLHVSFNKADINPINHKMTVGFSATASIKRSDFGMNTLLPSIGDNVDLKIEAEGYEEKKE